MLQPEAMALAGEQEVSRSVAPSTPSPAVVPSTLCLRPHRLVTGPADRGSVQELQSNAPDWMIVRLTNLDAANASLRYFERSFTLVLALCFLVITFLSQSLIRRTLGPLERLTEGTRRLARGDFAARVAVKNASDEFGKLASSFNLMGEKLQFQFRTLGTMHDVVQSILSRLNPEEIVDCFLRQAPTLFPTARIGILLLPRESRESGTLYCVEPNKADPSRHNVPLTPADVDHLESAARDPQSVSRRDHVPSFAQGDPEILANGCQVIPLAVDGVIYGSLNVCMKARGEDLASAATHLCFLADQLAVAFSNARLLAELRELSLGAITALARTVDAKSQWTAGHSERVTKYSVAIARKMGLANQDVDRIRRGALLHDVGKIGVPNEILDKPGRLTPEELEIMKQHPVIGARILEPLSAFKEILPIVLHHHERLDGKGYPLGISGAEILPEVRIVSVADVFDALTSDRPYRRGMPFAEAMQILRDGMGTQFDPAPVAALETIVTREPATLQIAALKEEASGEPVAAFAAAGER